MLIFLFIDLSSIQEFQSLLPKDFLTLMFVVECSFLSALTLRVFPDSTKRSKRQKSLAFLIFLTAFHVSFEWNYAHLVAFCILGGTDWTRFGFNSAIEFLVSSGMHSVHDPVGCYAKYFLTFRTWCFGYCFGSKES